MLRAKGVLSEPILVGRERELKELESYLSSALKGKGKTVFISGEAGAGKTRLVSEFLETVRGKVTVLSGWCLSDISIPYFPFMEAFKKYFKTVPPGKKKEINEWLGGPKQVGKPGKLQNLSPQGWQDLTVAAVTESLLSISEDKTTILFIDDMQWADSASLALLHYVSRSINSARILVLATYRSDELNPDAEGHPHPLLQTIRLMRRENLLDEINLPNLSRANVVALSMKIIGDGLHSELIEQLEKESQGNPLFIIESLRMLYENQSLILDNGSWRLSIDEVGIPTKIKDIILQRAGMLKPNQRRIIDLASVIGEKFDVELLGSVLGQDSLEVLEVLNAVANSSSLVRSVGSYYEFDHARSREAIYEQISQPLKEGYHARIAEKLKAQSKGKDLPVNDLAYHYARAGIVEKAVTYALAAGEDALARYSNTEAEKQFKYVLNTVQEKPEYFNERVRALEGLGDALNAVGLVLDAMNTFDQLSKVAASGMVKLRALRKAIACSFWAGNSARSEDFGVRALEYASADRLEYARLRLHRGFVADRRGKTEEAVEDLEGALKVFEEEYSPNDVAKALADISFFYMGQRRIRDQFTSALRSVTLFEELEDKRGEILARGRLDWPLKELGLYNKALDNLEKGVRIGEKVGDYNLTSFLFWGLAVIYALRGDTKVAVAQSLKAVEYAERTNAYMTLSFCYSYLVRTYARTGEIERAEEYQKKRQRLIDEKLISPLTIRDPVLTVGKAFILLAKGQTKEANEIFEKMIEATRDAWGSHRSISIREDYAWALQKQERIEEAKKQMEIADKMKQKLLENAKRLEHANIIPYFMAQREIGIGEEATLRLDLINFAQQPAKLVRLEGLIPEEFKVTAMPLHCSLHGELIEVHERSINPFSIETLNLAILAQRAGVFAIEPQIVYVDEMGQTKTCKPQPITVTVRPTIQAKIGEKTITVPILPDRITTGNQNLDTLLLGGIPKNYAIILTTPTNDEKTQLIGEFLEAGTNQQQPTIYITAETRSAETLAKQHDPNLHILICNPQAGATIQNMSNFYKMKGIENLTEIDITLTKMFRALKPENISIRRMCIDIISDALLQHHAINTRRWLSALLPTLKLKGFTILAVMNPQMHTPEECQAITSLFDGEIEVTEKGQEKTVRVKKLLNQKYLEEELRLTKETLSS